MINQKSKCRISPFDMREKAVIAHIKLTDDEIKGKRIMVIVDELDLTLLYRMCLEYYGFEVETYNKPRNALSSFKTGYSRYKNA